MRAGNLAKLADLVAPLADEPAGADGAAPVSAEEPRADYGLPLFDRGA